MSDTALKRWRRSQPPEFRLNHESTGIVTVFTDLRDPEPRSRNLFAFHQPRALAEWAAQAQTRRSRLCRLPILLTDGLWPPQIEAIIYLEQSLADNRPRALIQLKPTLPVPTGYGSPFSSGPLQASLTI